MKLIGKLFLGLALATCISLVGCGDDKPAAKPAAPAAPATGGDKKEGAMNNSATGDEMVLVSLKLPNMT